MSMLAEGLLMSKTAVFLSPPVLEVYVCSTQQKKLFFAMTARFLKQCLSSAAVGTQMKCKLICRGVHFTLFSAPNVSRDAL